MAANLAGKVAVVAGASRGAGRGIALALGETGAVVYVAGRTTRDGPRPFDGAPGTVEDTAEEVTRRGGRGIAVRADCSVEADVAGLFERVQREEGRLDVAANGVWGSSQQSYDQFFGKDKRPFWELPSLGWRESIAEGAYAHLLVARHAARLMAPRGQGLIVSITEPNDDYAGGSLFWLFTTFGHRCINKMVAAMSPDLAKAGVAAVALCPGFMRTERVLMTLEAFPEGERDKMKRAYGFDKSESTEYAGRAVAALAADPKVMRKSGQLVHVGDLAREYGFTDVDGRRPHFFEEVLQKTRPKKKAARKEQR
jgi:NAD(P)-dependent dehydrogenase (short-subunit alcohol dehydrogenase family)